MIRLENLLVLVLTTLLIPAIAPSCGDGGAICPMACPNPLHIKLELSGGVAAISVAGSFTLKGSSIPSNAIWVRLCWVDELRVTSPPGGSGSDPPQ